MTRKITADDIRKAVNDAYNEYKNLDKGAIDPRLAGTADADRLGITVMLVDGTTINKGDTTDVEFILTHDELALYDIEMNRVTEPGEFTVIIGSASNNIHLIGSFTIE